MRKHNGGTEKTWPVEMLVQDLKEMFAACRNAIAGAGVALAEHEAKINQSELTPGLVNKWIRRLNSAALLLIFAYFISVGMSMWSAWATETYFWEVMSPDERTEIKRRIENRVLDAGFSKIHGVQYAESTPQIEKSDKKKGSSK